MQATTRGGKAAMKLGSLLLNGVTETADLVDALVEGLPKNIRAETKKLGLHLRIKSLLDHAGEIDWVKATNAVAKNQLEDAIVGRIAGAQHKAGLRLNLSRTHSLGAGRNGAPDFEVQQVLQGL